MEVEPYVEHVNLVTLPLCVSVKCEFKMKPQLKVNPFSLGVLLLTQKGFVTRPFLSLCMCRVKALQHHMFSNPWKEKDGPTVPLFFFFASSCHAAWSPFVNDGLQSRVKLSPLFYLSGASEMKSVQSMFGPCVLQRYCPLNADHIPGRANKAKN